MQRLLAITIAGGVALAQKPSEAEDLRQLAKRPACARTPTPLASIIAYRLPPRSRKASRLPGRGAETSFDQYRCKDIHA